MAGMGSRSEFGAFFEVFTVSEIMRGNKIIQGIRGLFNRNKIWTQNPEKDQHLITGQKSILAKRE